MGEWKSGKLGTRERPFQGFEVAFAYCRQRDQPVTVYVLDEKWKLYPSGSAKEVKYESVEEVVT